VEGRRVFGAEDDPEGDTVYAFSLFTNDDPGERHRTRERGLGHDRRRQVLCGGERATERARRRDQELHARGVTTLGSGIGSGRPATLQNANRPLWKSTAARYG